MELDGILKPAKTARTGGSRGFVFAAEISEDTRKELEAIRDKARAEGKVLSNVNLAEAAIHELHKAYVKGAPKTSS